MTGVTRDRYRSALRRIAFMSKTRGQIDYKDGGGDVFELIAWYRGQLATAIDIAQDALEPARARAEPNREHRTRV